MRRAGLIIFYYEKIETPNGSIKEVESSRIFFQDGICWFGRTNGYLDDEDFNFAENLSDECGIEIEEKFSGIAY